mgnify:CR=1 FL=1
MEKWRIIFSKSGKQDWKTVSTSIYKNKVMELLSLIEIDPFKEPPSYKSLQGDMKGAFSRKINDQHRLVYRVDEVKRIVNVILMWSHYE